ncbi:MAG: PxKF domain-containing protein [Patescibacteria group bacterium]
MILLKKTLRLGIVIFVAVSFWGAHSVYATVYTGPTGITYSDFHDGGITPAGFKDILVRCPEPSVGGVNSLKDGTIFGHGHSCNNFEPWRMQDNMGVNGNNNDEQIADGHYCIYINGGDPNSCTHGEFDVIDGLLIIGEPACTVDCFSNVLFLPGLESSRLYKQRSIIGEDQLWEPNTKSDVEDLYLNPDGTPMNPNIYTRDIIKETNTPFPTGPGGQNIYKSFVDTMDQLVADSKINSWKSYAYDWRQSVDDIVNNGTNYQDDKVSLIDTLQSLVGSASKNGKVTIVAHSNGGLLAKALLQKLQDDKDAGVNNLIDNVNVLILVAVPEIGTAKAVPAILHGYDQRILSGWLLDEIHARELGRNMLGAYGLLPSREYINHVSASPATFVDNSIPSGITTDMVQAFGSAIDSYDEYKDFLFGNEGRTNPLIGETNLPINLSSSLFTQAENLHDNIDAWTPPEDMRVIEVAGWGLDTVVSMEYYPKSVSCPPGAVTCPPYIMDERPRFTADGDGTVVVPSAHYTNFLSNAEKYWVNLLKINKDKFFLAIDSEHKNIFETQTILEFISSIVQKTTIIDNYLSTTTPIDSENRFRISIHSPVTLEAYAGDDHTGKVCPLDSDFCYIEENITNSSYMEFGEGKYLNLSENGLQNIKIKGTDTGTFTFNIDEFQGDNYITGTTFKDIPVTPNTKVSIDIQNDLTTLSPMQIDKDGDGDIDIVLNPQLGGIVTPHPFNGFLQPINDTTYQTNQKLSVFKAGSTIPVKFQLKKTDGTILQTNTPPIFLSPKIIFSMSASIDEAVYSLPATTGNTFKWDSESQQYIYNWSTKGFEPGKEYKLSVQLDDGGTYSVVVGLK